jgi:hypothetical protein
MLSASLAFRSATSWRKLSTGSSVTLAALGAPARRRISGDRGPSWAHLSWARDISKAGNIHALFTVCGIGASVSITQVLLPVKCVTADLGWMYSPGAGGDLIGDLMGATAVLGCTTGTFVSTFCLLGAGSLPSWAELVVGAPPAIRARLG